MADKGNTFKTLMVDDMRLPNFPEEVTLVTNSKDALEIISSDRQWDYIYLDHDLGGDDTIRPVLDFLVKNKRDFSGSIVYIISSNPVGVNMIKTALDRAGFLSIVLTENQKIMLFHHRDWVDETGY